MICTLSYFCAALREFIFTFFAFVVCLSFSAQSYFLNGSASASGNDCYVVTPNSAWQNGTVWYGDQLNLLEPFVLEFYMNFGSLDASGADGMVFVLQTVGTSAIGMSGGGMGFQGFDPSFGIEFDTFQNNDVSDPATDHVAFLKNGNINHNSTSNLAGPVQANASLGNIEDSQNHIVKIVWNPANQLMQLYVDCSLRLSENVNLVNSIFNGITSVYWGFTGATGGFYNQQSVCLGEIISSQSEDTAICIGESVGLSASGNPLGSFVWTPAATLDNPNIREPIATPLATTTYSCTYTDLCNQQTVTSVTVTVEDFPVIDAGEDIDFCEDSSVQLDATSSLNNVLITWTTTNGNIQSGINSLSPVVDSPGLYTLSVETPLAGCESQDVLVLSEIPLPVVNLPANISLCPGETASLDAGSNWDVVEWSTGEFSESIQVSQAGTYTSTVTENGCQSSSSAVVSVVSLPVIDLGPDDEICAGSPFTIDAGVTGVWSNGVIASSITITQAGTYSVVYTTSNCSTNDSIVITAVQPPVFDLGSDIEFCEGDTIFLEIPYSGTWNNNVTGFESFYTEPGSAEVIVQQGPCTVTDELTLIRLPDPVLDFPEQAVYCTGRDITLSALDPVNDNYNWSTGESAPFISIEENGIYEVTVSNECGELTDSIEVVFEECNFYIYVPNAFTPNGDRINDYLFVYADNLKQMEFEIFNRWGQVVFRNTDIEVPWTGEFQGGDYFVPDGVYVYQLRYESETGEVGNWTGTVCVVR